MLSSSSKNFRSFVTRMAVTGPKVAVQVFSPKYMANKAMEIPPQGWHIIGQDMAREVGTLQETAKNEEEIATVRALQDVTTETKIPTSIVKKQIPFPY